MGTEECLSLCGGPHPLVQLVEDDGVFCEGLNNVHRLQGPLPLQSCLLVKEEIDHLVCRDTLRRRGEGERRGGGV